VSKDEYTRLRLILAQRFEADDKTSGYWDCTPPEVRARPGWRPYGRMDAALAKADELLRAADVTCE
jgi:hypothetical protein